MADLWTPISLMFTGAGLALSGFAIGQLVERRRWMAWVRPKKPRARFKIQEQLGASRIVTLRGCKVRVTGGYSGPPDDPMKPLVPPIGGSGLRRPSREAPDA